MEWTCCRGRACELLLPATRGQTFSHSLNVCDFNDPFDLWVSELSDFTNTHIYNSQLQSKINKQKIQTKEKIHLNVRISRMQIPWLWLQHKYELICFLPMSPTANVDHHLPLLTSVMANANKGLAPWSKCLSMWSFFYRIIRNQGSL